ncbi:hypothetical protein Gohar_017201 [Gossypium harknessii]|uniref:Uncharacterized protein n=1 Tax=Gossypium harknessii TaxID=34285 RepID=A0A7J9G552_9ROSI|nr:hypothetical protein [Gossypium harknessii]
MKFEHGNLMGRKAGIQMVLIRSSGQGILDDMLGNLTAKKLNESLKERVSLTTLIILRESFKLNLGTNGILGLLVEISLSRIQNLYLSGEKNQAGQIKE